MSIRFYRVGTGDNVGVGIGVDVRVGVEVGVFVGVGVVVGTGVFVGGTDVGVGVFVGTEVGVILIAAEGLLCFIELGGVIDAAGVTETLATPETSEGCLGEYIAIIAITTKITAPITPNPIPYNLFSAIPFFDLPGPKSSSSFSIRLIYHADLIYSTLNSCPFKNLVLHFYTLCEIICPLLINPYSTHFMQFSS